MTKDGGFKKVVRQHAQDTGQRYTEALTDLNGLGARMYHEPPVERLLTHLGDRYGVDPIAATKLSVHKTYVFRIDRSDGAPWVARAFPPARPRSGVEGDAAILRFLEARGYTAQGQGALGRRWSRPSRGAAPRKSPARPRSRRPEPARADRDQLEGVGARAAPCRLRLPDLGHRLVEPTSAEPGVHRRRRRRLPPRRRADRRRTRPARGGHIHPHALPRLLRVPARRHRWREVPRAGPDPPTRVLQLHRSSNPSGVPALEGSQLSPNEVHGKRGLRIIRAALTSSTASNTCGRSACQVA